MNLKRGKSRAWERERERGEKEKRRKEEKKMSAVVRFAIIMERNMKKRVLGIRRNKLQGGRRRGRGKKQNVLNEYSFLFSPYSSFFFFFSSRPRKIGSPTKQSTRRYKCHQRL